MIGKMRFLSWAASTKGRGTFSAWARLGTRGPGIQLRILGPDRFLYFSERERVKPQVLIGRVLLKAFSRQAP